MKTNPFQKINISKNIENLTHRLQCALESPTKTFDEINNLNKCGLYLVFDEGELLYLGMTTRKGKNRLREMTADYRSHTFNKKLLAELFRSEKIYRNDNEDVIHVLSKKTVAELIENKRLTSEQFSNYQRIINKKIRTFKFKFFECNLVDLPWIEHFAIAVLMPLYND